MCDLELKVLSSEIYKDHISETPYITMKEKFPPDQASLSIYTSNFYLVGYSVTCQAPLSMEFFRQEHWSG